MLFAGTPLNPTREAIVQDLFRLAFFRQLEASNIDPKAASEPIGDEAINRLLREIAEILARTDHEEDAAILNSLATQPPERSAGGIRALIEDHQRKALAVAPTR